MTPQDLVSAIRANVIDEDMEIFKRLFSTTPSENATDPYWKRSLALFQRLSADERNVLFEIVRNTAVATTSHMLGVLDGANAINVKESEMKLIATVNGAQLNGELQNIFLLEEERNRM